MVDDRDLVTHRGSSSCSDSLRGLIASDFRANARSLWSPGFHSLLFHRLGVWAQRHPAATPLGLVAKAGKVMCRNLYGVEIHPDAQLGCSTSLPHGKGITITARSVVGCYCIIRQGCTLGAASHARQRDVPTLEDNVELGASVTIYGRVVIGKGTRIGPNVALWKDTSPGSVVLPPSPIVR